MRVKIGDRIYDAEKEPIMLIFENDEELVLIANQLAGMPANPGNIRKYLMFPGNIDKEVAIEFMKI